MAKYYCKIGGAIGDIGEIKFGFYGPENAYKNCGAQLGVTKISSTSSARGVGFGTNRPKPPKVRISYKQGTTPKSTIRYCDTDKIGQVLNGGLNNNKVTVRSTEHSITGASMG